MKLNQMGNSDLKVNPMGLGCMGMSDFYGSSEEQQNIQTLHAALELGVNFFDTADMYGIGKNEKLLAKAFRDRWDQVVLATKFGIMRDSSGQFLGVNGSPEYVKSSCEKSLQRLGIDTIDLYYLHRADPNVPIEETVGAMKELVTEGKVRYIGLSEVNAETIRRAAKIHPITALQTEYSLWTRHVEEEILSLCQELNIAFVAYSPLGRGFLTGKINSLDVLEENDWRRQNPRFQAENVTKNNQFIELLQEIAQQKNATPAQIALAWLHHQGNYIFSIPGTRKTERVKENLAALSISFTTDELNNLRTQLPEASGERYPSQVVKYIES